MSVKRVCDRCNREIFLLTPSAKLDVHVGPTMSYMLANMREGEQDLCMSCSQAFIKFMDGGKVEGEEEEE